jgi:phosphoribosylformylglycinamidine cyclo-ligase
VRTLVNSLGLAIIFPMWLFAVTMANTYKDAGVDIDAGNEFVNKIKPLIESTRRSGVMSGFGGFGGFFALNTDDMKEPVLVSGTDGVGTKLMLAIEMQKFDTIGIDLVAMCVNDIACCGASPLFFLDYMATGKLKPDEHIELIKGIADGCRQSECALIGGETAEMPDLYSKDDFDLAGFAVGIVDRSKIIEGHDIGIGNAIVGIDSSGFHSNGYSLVRKILRDNSLDLSKTYDGLDRPLGEMLLEPTIIYSRLVKQLMREFEIKGVAHITGGGLSENIPRVLPKAVQAAIDPLSWNIPQLFRFLQGLGSIEDSELLRVFNCGIGLILITPQEQATDLVHAIEGAGLGARIMGKTRQRAEDAPSITFE